MPVLFAQILVTPLIVPAAAGIAVTSTDIVLVELPAGPVTVNDIVFVPAVLHEIVKGPAVVALATEASVPKFHE